MLSILYLLTPHCVPSWVFFFNLIIAFSENMYYKNKRYRGRQQDNQRYKMASVWRNAEQPIWLHRLKRILLYLLQSIQTWIILDQANNDYSLSLMTKEQLGDLGLSRDQFVGTWMKSYHPQLLNTAVQVLLSPGDLVRSLCTCKDFLGFSLVPADGHCQTREINSWHDTARLFSDGFRTHEFGHAARRTNKPLLHPARGPGAGWKCVIYNLTLVHILIWRTL